MDRTQPTLSQPNTGGSVAIPEPIRARRAIDHNQCVGLSVALFEESDDALILVDAKSMSILDANGAAQRLCGFALRDLLDSSVAELFRTEANHPLDLGGLPGRKVQAPYSQRHIQMKTFRSGVWLAVDLTLVRLAIRPAPLMLLTVRPIQPDHSDLCAGSDDETVY